MKFQRLRLCGFKSFVDPTEFHIEPGLTGVVGPNGCGKSNILESLRWVMGATSAKALRGAGMEDVIFAGAGQRPSRNWAEVTLVIDNAERRAPPQFNDDEVLEVTRRIQRDGGSSYKINGREARAKDVQRLFADASSGANSPALVRQGQISELINAKPQNRRMILEEAAGVTGLHSRRHEAELRLRAAETNLTRLEDMVGQLDEQRSGLARQARQASRYRNLSGHIRRTEAVFAYLRWQEALLTLRSAETALSESDGQVEEAARIAASASKQQSEMAALLPDLRERAAERAAALHRLTVAREALDKETARAEEEAHKLSGYAADLEQDLARESILLGDAETAEGSLAEEQAKLSERVESEDHDLAEARARVQEERAQLKNAEAMLESILQQSAEFDAKRRNLQHGQSQAAAQAEKVRTRLTRLDKERSSQENSLEDEARLRSAFAQRDTLDADVRQRENALNTLERDRAAAQERERELRAPARDAEQAHISLKAEADALRRMLADGDSDGFAPALDMVTVDEGYEAALAAAFGDDLLAALDEAAPSYWAQLDGGEPVGPLPTGVEALSRFVQGPPQLLRRLRSIGVIENRSGKALQPLLKPGQRIVSRQGDLWRWDGFAVGAESRAAAARLEQKNRLKQIEAGIDAKAEAATRARADLEAAAGTVERLQKSESETRVKLTEVRRQLEQARRECERLDREAERRAERLAVIDGELRRLQEEVSEAAARANEASQTLLQLGDGSAIQAEVDQKRSVVDPLRDSLAEANARCASIAGQAAARRNRLSEIEKELENWRTRRSSAAERLEALTGRRQETLRALEAAKAKPAQIEQERSGLVEQIDHADSLRKTAADALAEAESKAGDADRAARAAEAELSKARETRAREDAHLEGARERLEVAIESARETCGREPEGLAELAEIDEGDTLPDRDDVERKLERYKRERENLGGVNLRAEEEMRELDARLEEIHSETADLEGAIEKLREAISKINREGRERMNKAFNEVNENFQTLFRRLFDGGQAELRMVDSEDPLEAGLEIFASPPGKRLASMSLMSGGEQALTATALIFAVFIANPAPVCVLDEVDAPLDDANVDRFCRLMDEMSKRTETRFIIITHHPMTMSRVNRLFGVTMAERGVSQLVSVDLKSAEQLVAAE